MLRKKLLIGAVSLCAVVTLFASGNVIKSKADNSLQTIEVTGTGEDSDELEVVVSEVEKPKLWKKYISGDAIYKVTLPLTNGKGNVSYVTNTNKDITEVLIPDEVTINGIVYQVTNIEKEAFEGCSKLKKVVIGKEVKSIEKRAFANLPKLKKVSIGSKVKKIEKEAFKNCTKLKEIDIPKKVKSIDTEAFAQCYELKKVVIGKTVKTIGKKAFYDCGNLKKVQIGKSVKTISKEAFYKCDSLKDIRIKGDSLAKIGKDAFRGIRSDAEFKIDSDDYDRIAALFTAEVGYEPTMTLEIKKGILETLQDWFSDPEDEEVIEESTQEVVEPEGQVQIQDEVQTQEQENTQMEEIQTGATNVVEQEVQVDDVSVQQSVENVEEDTQVIDDTVDTQDDSIAVIEEDIIEF